MADRQIFREEVQGHPRSRIVLVREVGVLTHHLVVHHSDDQVLMTCNYYYYHAGEVRTRLICLEVVVDLFDLH